MDSKLKSLYLRMDADIQTLSDNARAQFIIKSLYTANKTITKSEILTIYKEALGIKRIDENRICNIIDELSENGTILVSGNHYSLPKSSVRKIRQEIEASSNRLESLLNKYFGDSFSNRELIKEWLIDAIIVFFSTYSNAWISDLTSKERSVESKREDIIGQINNRTNTNKELDSRDRNSLSKKFFNFITATDPEVTLFLWEYGTSAFSARLVKNTSGTDELSIDIFNSSNCLLDTNVLIDVALEGNERHEALDVLSEIMKELNMNVYTLQITRDEYKNKINSKYSQVRNLMHGSLIRALTKAEDQFMSAAGIRKCRDIEDFEIFFQEIGSIPTAISETIVINDYPEDETLRTEIENFIKDESLRNEYQSLYTNMHGRAKRNEPLNHDLGLIGAARHLCKNQKIFILSDDSTLNQYAKRIPFDFIPISIRIDTLINVLAVKQGGLLNYQTSFQELFANIIRSGFNPRKDTFQLEDLSYMYEKNIQIASLDIERVEEIACEINKLRMKETPDKDISQALMRYIQGEKIKIRDDYHEMRNKFIEERNENAMNKQNLVTANNTISILAEKNARHTYGTKLIILCMKIICVFFILIPGIFYGGIRLINYMKGSEFDNTDLWLNLVISIIVDVVLGFKYLVPSLLKMIFQKSICLNEIKKEEMDYLNQ